MGPQQPSQKRIYHRRDIQTSVQSIPLTPRWGQQDTAWPGSIRNSIPPWGLSSPCPLEAGAVTAPLPWDGYMLVHPLPCQRRSRSVIFHYCCWSNVSILATFKSFCSPCHHWDLEKLFSSFPVHNLHEGLKPWDSCRQKQNYQISCLCHSLFFIQSGTFSHSSSRTPISCKGNKLLVMFWRILSILGGLKAQKLLWHQTQEIWSCFQLQGYIGLKKILFLQREWGEMS